MMDGNDGLEIRYTWFVYSGRLVRSFFKNIFVDHVFEIPMWDRTVGLGAASNTICMPLANPLLSLFSALIPAKYSEYAFNLVVIIRLYLAGGSFLLFANEKGYKNTDAVAGAMVYVFSSTAYVIFMQISFSSTFILFPLLLLGAERVWKKQKYLLYVLVLTYSTFRTFYFTYMMLIYLVIYCFIRFFCEEERSFKRFFTLFFRFVILTLLSLGISLGTILPGVLRTTSLSRVKAHHAIDLLNLDIFKRFFLYGFSCIQADGDALIGVSSFVFIAAVCLFAFNKKEKVIKWCLPLTILSFAVPIVGSIFNGFNYPSFRYIFGLILCVSYMVTVSFDSIKYFKGMFWYVSIGMSLLYCAICYLFRYDHSFLSALSLLITVLSVGTINIFERLTKNCREILYIAVILFSCTIIGYSCFHISLSPSMMDSGSLYETVFVDGGMKLRKAVDDPKYRTETINEDFIYDVTNSSYAAEISGCSFYSSDIDQNVQDYYNTLKIISNPREFYLNGFRGRCYLEILNACKYITINEENETCIRAPYSYDYVKTEENYGLYKARQDISLVYFYDNTVSTEAYMETDPLTRETTLMHSMVLDNPIQPEADIVSDAIPVSFEVVKTDNVQITDKKISVYEEGGYIVLKPNDIKPGQISVYLKGLKSSDVDNWYFRTTVALTGSDNNPISIDYSAQCKTDYQYYYGNDDMVFSFESIDEKVESIYLIFTYPGEYDLDSIQVYSRPYEIMEQTLEEFYDHAGMEDISYDYSGNHLNISATTESDRYLYMAIPYSAGWTAKVDGEPAEILRANMAFMAIPLSSGTHNIEMTYRSQYLYEGIGISAAGLAVFVIVYLVIEKKKARKLNEAN